MAEWHKVGVMKRIGQFTNFAFPLSNLWKVMNRVGSQGVKCEKRAYIFIKRADKTRIIKQAQGHL